MRALLELNSKKRVEREVGGWDLEYKGDAKQSLKTWTGYQTRERARKE